MISIQKMRELVKHSENLTDDELEEARTSIYGLVEIAFDMWRGKKLKQAKAD